MKKKKKLELNEEQLGTILYFVTLLDKWGIDEEIKFSMKLAPKLKKFRKKLNDDQRMIGGEWAMLPEDNGLNTTELTKIRNQFEAGHNIWVQ
jgi:hypothetical protein